MRFRDFLIFTVLLFFVLQKVHAVGPIYPIGGVTLITNDPYCDPNSYPTRTNFKIGSLNVTSFHPCSLGYITIDGVHENLTQPSDINNLSSSTIVAVGLVDPFGSFSGNVSYETTFQTLNAIDMGFFGSKIDPFFCPTRGFGVMWTITANLSLNSYISIFACDYQFQTLSGNSTKCVMALAYLKIDDDDQPTPGGLEYMAVGINSPDGGLLWNATNSQMSGVGLYYSLNGTHDIGYPISSSWVFELDQYWNGSGDFVKEYEPSDCTGTPPYCEDKISGLFWGWEPDVEFLNYDENCYSNGNLSVDQSFKVGNIDVQFFQICAFGYITLGPDVPEVLNDPYSFQGVQNSTIVAAGLITPFSMFSFALNVSYVTGYKNLTAEDLEQFPYMDDFFQPSQGFAVRWTSEELNFKARAKRYRQRRALATVKNDFQMVIVCDFSYPMISRPETKCVIAMEYYSVDVNSVWTNNGQEFMAVGINGPNQANYWVHPYFNSSNIGEDLLTRGNFSTMDGNVYSGLWLYELSQDGDTTDIVKEFQTSDCTGTRENPVCTNDNDNLVDFGPDAGDLDADDGSTLQLDPTVNVGGNGIISVTVSCLGALMKTSDCQSELESSSCSELKQQQPGCLFVTGGCNSDCISTNRQRQKRQNSVENKIFFRLLKNESDFQYCNTELNDQYFSCELGFIVTWYKIGNLAVDQTRTNSYQIMVGCDMTYNDTQSARCALIVIFGEMNNLLDADNRSLIAGIFGSDISFPFVNTTNDDLAAMAAAFTGTLRFELLQNSDGGIFIKAYVASDFKSGSLKINNTVGLMLIAILLAFVSKSVVV